MFTQCSNCNTIFELSADVLRAAAGQVRCGRCGEIFNAWARLAEDAGSFDTGESAFEMEERADSILEAVIAEQTLQAAPDAMEDEEEYGGPEIAQLQVLDFSEENLIDESVEDTQADSAACPEASMEFTLPPGELDRIFVESSVGIMPPFSTREPPPAAYEAEDSVAPEEAMHMAAAREQHESEQPAHEDGPLPEIEPLTEIDPLPDIEVISDNRSVAVRPQLSPLAELGAFDLREAPKRSAGSFAVWLSVAIAAALVLVGQVVHQNRQTLTAHGPLAPILRSMYQGLGAPLSSAPNLAAFQLRQWGVTGEAGGDATLRVRASILNTSSQMQPFPLLRVTLANRYGSALGSRDFAPNEYLGRPVARLLSPGEKVDAVLNILDPGKDAEGFEIDVCLPGGDKKIVCANDAAPSQARQ